MDEVVGGALLSAFFQELDARLGSEDIPKLFRGKKAMVCLVDELKSVLNSVSKLVDGAEEKEMEDERVRKWLYELNDAIYHADNLVDTIDTESLWREVEASQRSSFTCFSNILERLNTQTDSFDGLVKKEATEILGRLKSLLDQVYALGLRKGVEKLL